MLSLLDRWPWALGGVVIGGYAVNAYGPLRYSDDVDVVLSTASADATRGWLKSQGLRLVKHSVPNPQNLSGQVQRYESGDIALDLLTGAVRDRDAKVDVPESWISEKARWTRLETTSGKTSNRIPIARPEAIWALKLLSGRPRDISDLFAISLTSFDSEEVTALFRQLFVKTMGIKLLSVQSNLREPKTFVDSLSRRELGSPSDPRNIRTWEQFVTTVENLILPIHELMRST